MKTLKLVFVLAALVFASCADKDEAPAPEPAAVGPKMTYEKTRFETTFFSEGSSEVPTLNWNGEVGTLSLSNYITGINLNEDNGVVSWRKRLPLGVSEITVVATNSIGQHTVTMEIENIFQGDFTGEYNNDENSTNFIGSDYYALEFNSDGTMVAKDYGFPGEGTWTRDGNEITATYSYNGGGNFYTVVGELVYNSSKATFSGFWYSGETASPANIEGYFEITLD